MNRCFGAAFTLEKTVATNTPSKTFGLRVRCIVAGHHHVIILGGNILIAARVLIQILQVDEGKIFSIGSDEGVLGRVWIHSLQPRKSYLLLQECIGSCKMKLLPVHGLDGVKITAVAATADNTMAVSGIYYMLAPATFCM